MWNLLSVHYRTLLLHILVFIGAWLLIQSSLWQLTTILLLYFLLVLLGLYSPLPIIVFLFAVLVSIEILTDPGPPHIMPAVVLLNQWGTILAFWTTAALLFYRRRVDARLQTAQHTADTRETQRTESLKELTTSVEENAQSHHRTVRELKQTQNMLQLVFDTIPHSVFWKDRRSVYLGCNRNFAGNAGFTDPGDVIGKTDYDLTWGQEIADRIREIDSLVMETGYPKKHIIETRQSDGKPPVHLETIHVPLRDEQDVIIGVLGAYIDISDSITGTQKLMELNRFRESIIENANVWLMVLDRDGSVLLWNKAAEEISGYSRTEIIGQPDIWRKLLKNEAELDLVRTHISEILKKHNAFCGFENTIWTSTGEPRIISWDFKWMFDDDGVIVGGVVIGRDMTKHKHLERQLAQVHKMEAIGQLAGGIAHDFNNLLAVIIGNAEMNKRFTVMDSKMADRNEQILQVAYRGEFLVRQMLAFSRKQIIQPQHVDLNDHVQKSEPMLRQLTREDVTIEIQLTDTVESIFLDPAQLDQILFNLTTNAVDAMPDGGNLRIVTSMFTATPEFCLLHPYFHEGKYALLSLQDTGIGMSDGVIRRMFEPFFTTKEEGKGTGLGLSGVYGIVKQNDGHILVDSVLNQGTTFHVYFPAVERPTEELTALAGQLHAGGHETVLLAEDDPMLLNVLQRYLEEMGYRVYTATNGSDAMHLARKHADSLDVVITDIVMPGHRGTDVAALIRTKRPHVKVIFISGYTEQAFRDYILREGYEIFIPKPFKLIDFGIKLRELLGAK